MNQILKEAYTKITGQEPAETMKDWELADYLANSFNYRVLGEDLAKQMIFTIVNHVHDYPDDETTKRIVGKAEGIAEEMGIVDEGHMADIEAAENREGNKI